MPLLPTKKSFLSALIILCAYPHSQTNSLAQVVSNVNARVTATHLGWPTQPTSQLLQLTPTIRALKPEHKPFLTGELQKYRQFFNDSILFERQEFFQALQIVSASTARRMLGTGDFIYVSSAQKQPAIIAPPNLSLNYQIVKAPQAIFDPEHKHHIIGYEAKRVGKARLIVAETMDKTRAAKLQITASISEIELGDYLLPIHAAKHLTMALQPAVANLAGTLIKLPSSPLVMLGNLETVLLNKGAAAGLQPGQVYQLIKPATQLTKGVEAPTEVSAHLLVFKTFTTLSYALVLDAAEETYSGAKFRAPQ